MTGLTVPIDDTSVPIQDLVGTVDVDVSQRFIIRKTIDYGIIFSLID